MDNREREKRYESLTDLKAIRYSIKNNIHLIILTILFLGVIFSGSMAIYFLLRGNILLSIILAINEIIFVLL